MKVISTDRIDSSIEVYRDRIIIPRKVSTMYSETNGASTTDISYTATIIDDEDPEDAICQSMDEFKTLEGTLRIAKLTIDLSIEKFKEYL